MRKLFLPTAFSLMFAAVFCNPLVAAEQEARISVTVIATGSDSTQSEGEWSKGTVSYRAAFTTVVQTDGEASEMNMYDPDFAQKSMAAAAASMERIQAAMKGQFSDDDEPELEARYLFFLGEIDCPATLSLEVSETLKGEYADVGGMQPYQMTFTGKSNGTPAERNMLCVSSNSVLDIKDNTLYRSTLGFPEVTGHYVLHEDNRGNLIDNSQSVHSALPTIVSDYLFNTLRVAPASGSEKTTLTPTEPVLSRSGPFGSYHGSIEVELSWDFQPVQ